MYQKTIDCGDHKVSMRMEADYDRLVSLLSLTEGVSKELRYRVVNSKGAGVRFNHNIGATELTDHGTTTINGTFNANNAQSYSQASDKRYFVFRDDFYIEFDPNETY